MFQLFKKQPKPATEDGLSTLGEAVPAVPPQQPQAVDDVRRKELLDHRTSLQTQAGKSTESYEKNLLALSTAVLGGSIFILQKLTVHPPQLLWVLYCAWSGLGLSIGLLLVSFLLSVLVLHKNKDKIDEELKGFLGSAKYNAIDNQMTKLRKVIDGFNWTTFVLFSLGIIALLIFMLPNVTAKENEPLPPTQTQSGNQP